MHSFFYLHLSLKDAGSWERFRRNIGCLRHYASEICKAVYTDPVKNYIYIGIFTAGYPYLVDETHAYFVPFLDPKPGLDPATTRDVILNTESSALEINILIFKLNIVFERIFRRTMYPMQWLLSVNLIRFYSDEKTLGNKTWQNNPLITLEQ